MAGGGGPLYHPPPMPLDDAAYWNDSNEKVWRPELGRLLAAWDLRGLALCRKGLRAHIAKALGNCDTQEEEQERLERDLRTMLQFKVIELCRLLERYPWSSDKQSLGESSVDIQRLHAEISEAYPAYAKHGRQEYAQLRVQLSEGGGKLSRFLKDEFSGYDSDDSDDEEEDDYSYQKPKGGKKAPPLERMIPQHMRNNRFAPLLIEEFVEFPEFIRQAKSSRPTFRRTGDDPDASLIRDRVYEVLESRDFKWEDERHTANAQIHHTDWNSAVEADFKRVQHLFRMLQKVESGPEPKRGDKEKHRAFYLERLAKVKTKFCFAQYRGITYKTSAFDRKSRQVSRETVEVGQPIYSMAVFNAAGVSSGKYYAGNCEKKELDALDVAARALKQILLNKRESGGFTYLGYKYDSQAHALQDTYTNNYEFFHSAISAYIAERQGFFAAKRKKVLVEHAKKLALIKDEKTRMREENRLVYGFQPPETWAPYEGLPNAECPFVSTGDVPRHALKYAYGKKFYEGHHHERLLPRWNKEGRAERPYAGKVYATLHSLEEYIEDAPFHVRSLNNQGKIKVGAAIALERESTFPGYIPAQRLVVEHIAKLPSFGAENGWQELFLEKYGIDKWDYRRFHKAIRSPEVQSKDYGKKPNPLFKQAPKKGEDTRTESEKQSIVDHTGGSYINLDSWLVNFHEARLIELVRRMARKRGMFLIYRDENGLLSKELPVPLSIETEILKRAKASRTVGKRSFDQDLAEFKSKLQRNSAKQLKERPLSAQLGDTFVIHETPGDGNCLFHALAAALEDAAGVQKTDLELRQEIGAIFRGSAELRRQQNVTLASVAQMEQRARAADDIVRWGSDAEIIAFCRQYPVRVRVYSTRYPPPGYCLDFETFGGRIDHTLHLLNQGGNHWTWLETR